MAKRKGFILEKIADMDNLIAADQEAQDGKVKKNRFIRRHNARQMDDLQDLQKMILSLSFPDPGYEPMTVTGDCGKTRRIDRQNYYPWRILHHAIMRVIGKDIYLSLISDSFACVPGKGLHYGVKRMKMFLRRYPEYRYFWKTDYKKYYSSIPHDTIMAAFRRKYKDKKFLQLIEVAILNYDSGEELLKILEDEEMHKRHSHRSLHKPTDRKLHSEPHRPCDEGEAPLQVLPSIL